MKRFKKWLGIVLCAAMVLTMGVIPSFAADPDGSITVNPNFKDQTYTLYQLFDATTVAGRTTGGEGITYKIMNGKDNLTAGGVDGSQWFDVADDKTVTAKTGFNEDVLKSANFQKWAKAYGTVTGTAKTAAQNDDPNVKWEGLAEGYYFITTTTGSLVTVDSIKPNVTVQDKNTVPTVDKKITGASSVDDNGLKALAQVGTDVEYTATVTAGKGSKNLKYHDKMDAGLSFKADTVTVEGTGITTDSYTLVTSPTDGDTFDINFVDGIPEGTVITIKYKATITAAAVDTSQKNTAKISYGENNTTSEEHHTEVYNAQITVLKYDGDKANKKMLPGAGFKLKNADDKYYSVDSNGVVSWKDTEAEGKEFTSDTNGNVGPFTGLANGTYTLVETTVPSGYNKAPNTTVTINAHDYTAGNLSQTKEIENRSGSVLPGTGGMGTTMLYIGGAALIVLAGVLLFFRRKKTACKR